MLMNVKTESDGIFIFQIECFLFRKGIPVPGKNNYEVYYITE